MKKNTPTSVLILSALAVSAAFIVSVANARNEKISVKTNHEAAMIVKYDANGNSQLDPVASQTITEDELMAGKKKGKKKK